jgi:hypothetical protein
MGGLRKRAAYPNVIKAKEGDTPWMSIILLSLKSQKKILRMN